MTSPRLLYQKAHEHHFASAYPQAYADGHYSPPVYPKVATSNGLTTFVINMLNWQGHRATRISVSGRLIEKAERQASGVSLQTKKWLPSSTRKGTADISATIAGRTVMIEIKVGRDRPSEYQLAEQARERAARGIFEFIHTPEEFLALYDELIVKFAG